MLSKAATMLLGLIYQTPLNAYEITKQLQIMNVKQWYNIADSTVYATLKTLEKKELIIGEVEKIGNMPDRTVYKLTDKGIKELRSTLKQSILKFDYDTNVFSIAAFFISIYSIDEQCDLLSKRLDILRKYVAGIEEQLEKMKSLNVTDISIANVERVRNIVNAEITGTSVIFQAVSKQEK